jgi:O-acetyl-ADP-ribose deacetylase (regulator of RNase III)
MAITQRIEFGKGKILELVEGDITRETADAIVNAANSTLLGGGGVDGAIHAAGGPAILEACREIRKNKYPDGLPTGLAVATTAGQLAATYVIHTVGPIWQGGGRNEPDLLASCYRESIRLADSLRLSSIAFPSISTGAYGYPVPQAAAVALSAAMQAVRGAQLVKTVRFVLFDDHDFQIFVDEAHDMTI